MRIILFLLTTLLIQIPLLSQNIYYPSDIQKIKERDTLIVAQFSGLRSGFFDYTPESKLIGYDIDLAESIADELDVELRVDRTYHSFNDVAYAVAKGSADIAISKLSVTSERSQFLRYTKPYISLRMALLINRIRESAIGTSKTDPLWACMQKDVSIGVLDNSSFVDHGKNIFPKADLKRYPNQETLFEAVFSGEITAVLYEEYEIGKFMRKRPDLPIYCHMEEIPHQKDDIAMAVAGSNSTLLSFLNTFMDKQKIAPTVQYIIEHYIPEDELKESEVVTKLNFKNPALLVALLSAVGFLFLWSSLATWFRKSSGKGI